DNRFRGVGVTDDGHADADEMPGGGVLTTNISERALRVLRRDIDKRAQELVPSVPDDEVIGTDPFANRGDHLDKHAITSGVTGSVVHLLEAVDVKEDDRDALAADAAKSVDLALQRSEPRASAQRSGE